MATEPERVDGHVRTALDPELFQARGDGRVVYAAGFGDGSNLPIHPLTKR